MRVAIVICSIKPCKETFMARAALILSLVACGVTLLGLAGAHLGLVAPLTGFQLFAGGAILGGLSSVVVSLVGIVLSRGGGDPEGRRKSLMGLAIGLGLLIVVLGAATTAGDAPPINDITTDLDNPPAFVSASVVPDYKGRNMSYPPPFVEIVRESYPDLAPLRVASPPDATFERAIGAAESLGWKIVARSPSRGVFDAQHVSTIFRFVDDITVRIVADGPGSRIDMRSKSRDGKSDLGANAARIRVFFDALR
jgi:uncharacterized protein (DUF1499 family)